MIRKYLYQFWLLLLPLAQQSASTDSLQPPYGARCVDIRVIYGEAFLYYEFKSVKNIPTNFAEQFIKDLQLPRVTSIDQIKWIFDPGKISNIAAEKAKFVEALKSVKESLYVNKGVFEKYYREEFKSADALISKLNQDADWFNAIFQSK